MKDRKILDYIKNVDYDSLPQSYKDLRQQLTDVGKQYDKINRDKKKLNNKLQIIYKEQKSVSKEYTKLYKWQDEKGEWHFSDVKTEEYEQEVIKINNNRNVLNFQDISDKKEGEKENPQPQSDKIEDDKKSEEEGESKSYFDRLSSTLEDANNVQSQVDENFKKKEEAMKRN